MSAGGLIEELKRRRVFRALIGYGVAAFAILQVIEPIMHGLHWPDAVLTYVVIALALGFPVAIALAWIFDLKQGRLERAAGTPPSRRAALALALLAIGALAASPGLVYYFVLRTPRPAEPAQPSPASSPSIAVLPLVNLSSDREQEYFSDGLTEELLDLLAKVPGLRVAARTSSFAFKGKSEHVSAIAQQLHVAHVLEGSVRKAGDQIRISTQLVDAASGFPLWSETYDRKLTDVFAVQDEIGQSVVAALKVHLLKPPSSKERRTVNAEAFNQYLLGKQFFHLNNVDGFRRALQAFEKAVALDKEYAPAWAGLALARFWVADSSESLVAVKAGQERALEAAQKAIALAPDLPDGYLARGFVRVPIQWDWNGAREDLERALQLRPDDPEALVIYSQSILTPLGRLAEAVAAARKATELDPLSARAWATLGTVLAVDGKLAAARAALDRSLEISPAQSFTPMGLAVTFLIDGKPADALVHSARSTNEIFRLAGTALAQGDLGHRAESQRALDELIAKFPHDSAYQIAQVYAWRGDKDRALEWLERARGQRDGGLVYVKEDPLLRKLQGDPRYLAFLRSIKLAVN